MLTATNISTGEENLYQYNKKENTIQIYHNDSVKDAKINELEETNKNYMYVIIGLGSLLIITYVAILIANISRKKRRKKELEKQSKEKKTIFDDFDDEENVEKVEKKVK